MNSKRRRILILGGLGGFGLAFLAKSLWFRVAHKNSHSTVDATNPDLEPIAGIAPEAPPLRFVSLADTGTGAQGQYAVAKAMTRYHGQNSFSLVILAGDNIYNNGEIEKISAVFERPYQPLLRQGVKFQACLGNHDILTDNGDPQVRYPGFNMQGRYYTFRRDAVEFFALDTNLTNTWNTQLEWLEQELSRSDAPWKIVFGHHNVYSSGHYGVSEYLVRDLGSLFQKHGVQLYINGHEHHYERTHPINGTTYLSCGAGAGTRPVGRSAWTAYSAERLSFAAIEVYGDRIEISGAGTDNRVFDRGVIRKTPSLNLASV